MNQATQNNIINLNVKNPYTTILSFLDYKGENEKTKINYKKDIEDFFRITRNKDIDQLTIEDLNYTMQDAVNYRKTLQKLKDRMGKKVYKNKSINRKVSTVYNLFVYFKSNDYEVNPFAFKLDLLPTTDTKGSDYLTKEEMSQLIELAETKDNGKQKSLFLRLAYFTAIRLTALANLTWGDIRLDGSDYIIKIYDKGNKLDEKYIGEELYTELKQLKNDGKKSEKVFSLSYRTFQDTVPLLAKELGFSNDDRKITFHSLRKSSGVHTYMATEDVELTKKHMNHTSVEVTMNNYVNIKRDYTQTGSYILLNKNEDIDKAIDNIDDLDTLKKILKELSPKVKSELVSKWKNK